jgi:hypothetical protein
MRAEFAPVVRRQALALPRTVQKRAADLAKPASMEPAARLRINAAIPAVQRVRFVTAVSA